LHAVAAGLGADVAWFLGARQAILLGGIGDRRLAAAPVPTPWVVIAVPDLVVSTPQVYAAYAAATTDGSYSSAHAETTPRAVPGPNDLAAAALAVEPGLVDFVAALAEHGSFVQTGSGAACFTACADEDSARALAAAIAPLCEHARAVPVLGGPADPEADRPLLCP
jgi:4-diphosphocytidyl-2C-methyl-D-erythritol kinase